MIECVLLLLAISRSPCIALDNSETKYCYNQLFMTALVQCDYVGFNTGNGETKLQPGRASPGQLLGCS